MDFILERARATRPIMVTLASPPYNWMFDGPSPGAYEGQIQAVDDQVDVLAEAEAATTDTAALWDVDLETLIADAMLGNRLAQGKFAALPVKLRQFDNLRFKPNGREARYKQASAFEKAWKKADAAWLFKPGLTLAQFTTRRKAIRDREDAHGDAVCDERHERALLHSMAADLNAVSVKWYDIATATFAENTVPGQLIRTVPTTYNPNRPPGQLRFTAHLSSAPNHGHLIWRAARGKHFFIEAKGPSAAGFEIFIENVTDTEWMGMGLEPGVWQFRGYATNEHGQGELSEVVQITVAAAQAA